MAMDATRTTEIWEQLEHALAARGWAVESRLMWVADARRGHDVERAVGRTKDEAYQELLELTKLDELTGVP
jgi:hypothetical protein